MPNSIRLLILLPLLMGNTAPVPTSTEIIVTAPARATEKLKQQTLNFIRTISDTAGKPQLSRRDGPYCVKIVGISPTYHALILKKIRDAARVANSQKEAPEGCKPNIVVIFSTDGAAFTEALKRKRLSIFSGQPLRKFDELIHPKKPVRWWYGTETHGKDGQPIIDGTLVRKDASLISSGIEIDLRSTFIIVDVTLSTGYSLEAISAYISMLAFAQIDGSNVEIESNSSILGMFKDDQPRIAALRNLTIWDRAYLHALYSIPGDRPFWQQRKRLRGAMVDYIQKN